MTPATSASLTTHTVEVSAATLLHLDFVNRNPALDVGDRAHLEVMGTFADGQSVLLPASYVTFTSTNPQAVEVDASGTFKPDAELKAMYSRAGITTDKEVISYCQGGYRAAHSYVALRLIGFPKIRNYIGSWKEWGDRADLPIDQPSEQK